MYHCFVVEYQLDGYTGYFRQSVGTYCTILLVSILLEVGAQGIIALWFCQVPLGGCTGYGPVHPLYHFAVFGYL